MFQDHYDSQIERFKESFLTEAARCGRTEEVASLLDLSANPNSSPSEDEDSPLHAAVRNNHIDVATVLIAHGANVNKKTKGGNSALHLASFLGNEEMVALLLSANSASHGGFDDDIGCPVLNSVNDDGLTPFDLAVENGYWALGQTLKNLSDNLDDINSNVSDGEEDDDEIRDRFLSHSNVSAQEMDGILSYQWKGNNLDSDLPEDTTLIENSLLIAKLREEIVSLQQNEERYRKATHDAEEAIQILEKKCEVLESKRYDFTTLQMPLINQYFASKSIEELEAAEENIRMLLDKIITTKTSKLSQQAENRTCVICQNEPKTVLLMPCRHLCVCKVCSQNYQLISCPLCREKITERITVYS